MDITIVEIQVNRKVKNENFIRQGIARERRIEPARR